MIYETKINLKNKSKEELIELLKEALEINKKQQAELEKKDKRIIDLEYSLLDMIMQFADRPHKKGYEYNINTMGLSALELAFNTLNLDDPTPIKKANEIYENLQKQYFENKVNSCEQLERK